MFAACLYVGGSGCGAGSAPLGVRSCDSAARGLRATTGAVRTGGLVKSRGACWRRFGLRRGADDRADGR